MEDFDEQFGYDADHNDPSQYCEHGTWIGSWWGPDILCGFCEDGVTLEEMEAQAKIYRAKAGINTVTITVDDRSTSRDSYDVWVNKVPHDWAMYDGNQIITITNKWQSYDGSQQRG